MRIALLLGGKSKEREISLRSGEAVYKALKNMNFQVSKIDPASNNFLEKIKSGKFDLCFIALHGKYGEDGCIQGLLETLNIPYTGSGVLSSALAMNKIMAKTVFLRENIPTPPFISLKKGEVIKNKLKFPLIVKPTSQGSTIGVRVVKKKQDLDAAIKYAFMFDREIILEEYIKGKEITAPILGNSNPEVLPLIEIKYNSELYDYKSKYTKGKSSHIIPPLISKNVYQKIEEIAVMAHKSLHCEGISRVDLILDKDIPFVLEVNTIPGMTEVSLVPESAKSAGISFEDLVRRIINFAMEKRNGKS